ncbi:hypothetical protein WEI85_29425 [Actinomycetes bacterium KLBMP 9797]
MAVLAAPLINAMPAQAAPAKSPNLITIGGEGLTEPLSVRADDRPDLFNALLSQVNWLSSRKGQASGPKKDKLGPKYTVVVHVGDVAKQAYDLYPMASGGPRVHRPAKQPDKRKTTAAWFLGRLEMPDTLRAAGVPLVAASGDGQHNNVGGVGGGDRVFDDNTLNPGRDIDRLLGDLRGMLLLNGAVVLVITLGLAGIALLVRRRTR